MSFLDGWRHVARSAARRRHMDDETREELAYHLHRQTEKHIAAGLPRDEAQRRAALELGGAERWREETAAARRGTALFDLLGDASFSLCVLGARSGFSLSAFASSA